MHFLFKELPLLRFAFDHFSLSSRFGTWSSSGFIYLFIYNQRVPLTGIPCDVGLLFEHCQAICFIALVSVLG